MAGRTADFTQGGIIGKIVAFAVPIVLAEMLQNLYNTVDSMVVGNFVGDKALAAVSVCSAISQMVVGFFNGMSIGASVIAARYFGSGERERLGASMRSAFAFAVVLGLLLSIVGIFAAPGLLSLISVPAEVYGDAVVYLRIYLAGILFTVAYNVAAGLLRAVGDSRGPFNVLVLVCALNIVLDLLFVTVWGWGVAGVSAATVLSQMVAVLVVFFRLKKHDGAFRLAFGELSRERDILRRVVSIGMPAGMQNCLISFSNLFVWRYISGFDAAAMAGLGAAQRIDRFVTLPCKGFGMAQTTFVSQNVGARKSERVKHGFKSCLLLSLSYCFTVSAALFAAAPYCIRLFNDTPAVVAAGIDMMHVMLPFYGFMALREVCLGTLRGYGDTRVPMILSLIGMVVLRQIYLATALALDRRIIHVYIGYPLAWAATAALTLGYYLAKRRRYEAMTSFSGAK